MDSSQIIIAASVISLIPILISIFLVLAIFEMNRNIRGIRKVIDKSYKDYYKEEAWIFDEEEKTAEVIKEKINEEKKESIWNKKIF